MRQGSSARTFRLGARQLLELQDAKGVSVAVTDGAVWITQSGDPRDVVLEAGDAFTLDRRGLAVLSALTDAKFHVLEAGAAEMRDGVIKASGAVLAEAA